MARCRGWAARASQRQLQHCARCCYKPSRKPCCCSGGATRIDHRASYQLAQAALAGLPQPPRQLEYVVWAWERAAPDDLLRADDRVRGFRLNIETVLPQKQRVIAAHRSQVAPGVFVDDAEGFLLSAEMLAHFERPEEVFFEAA